MVLELFRKIRTKASLMYYRTKLCSHNFTVYNLSSHQCTNYWFNETECDLTASTFSSCVIDYLENNCLDPKLKIVIYSDGCTHQNRNSTLSNALMHFSIKNNIEMELGYNLVLLFHFNVVFYRKM